MQLEQTTTLLQIRVSIERISPCDVSATHCFARQRGVLHSLRHKEYRRDENAHRNSKPHADLNSSVDVALAMLEYSMMPDNPEQNCRPGTRPNRTNY
jgi:hypothetical protein